MRSFAICDTLSFAIVCHLIDTMLNLKHYLKQLKAKTFFFFFAKGHFSDVSFATAPFFRCKTKPNGNSREFPC